MDIEWNESFFRATLLGSEVKEMLNEQQKRVENALKSAGVSDVYTDFYRGDRRNAIDVRGEILPKEAYTGATARVFGGL